jgi:hypothetical protein
VRLLFTIPQIFVAVTGAGSIIAGGWYGLDALEARPALTKELRETKEDLVESYETADAEQTKILEGLAETQQQLTTSVVELKFQTLATKKKLGHLDFMEQQQYCQIAKKLEYSGVEGCP